MVRRRLSTDLCVLFLTAAAAGIVGEKRRREATAQTASKRPWHWLDHTLVAWVVENACVVGSGHFLHGLIPTPKFQSRMATFRMFFVLNVLQSWLLTHLQAFLAHSVYRHVPSFSEHGRVRMGLKSQVLDYLYCNLPNDIFGALLLSTAVCGLTKERHQHLFDNKVFSPLSFVKKLAVVRFGVDVAFYAGHRVLHHPSIYHVHRRHHEHFKPGLPTNFHFSPVDLFVEAGISFGSGMGLLDLLAWQPTHYEATLIQSYIAWHLIGSHAGKPVPFVTYFPPLAPLYQLAIPGADDMNIEHHDVHHGTLNCNYGITIWPDVLMGTRKVPTRASS